MFKVQAYSNGENRSCSIRSDGKCRSEVMCDDAGLICLCWQARHFVSSHTDLLFVVKMTSLQSVLMAQRELPWANVFPHLP